MALQIRATRLTLSLTAWAVLGLTAEPEPAGACSCGSPDFELVSPLRAQAAPLNTKIRVVMPNSSMQGTSAANARLVLRRVKGAEVAVQRRESEVGRVRFVELEPEAPLEPAARYEVALTGLLTAPRTYVFGSFRTSAVADTDPPTGGQLGGVTVYRHKHFGGGMCSIGSPWAEALAPAASDPGRPGAALAYAVWLPAQGGKLDTKAPPLAYLTPRNGKLTFDQTSLCDPLDLPLPGHGVAQLAVALTDEAGNLGKIQRVSLNLSNPKDPTKRP